MHAKLFTIYSQQFYEVNLWGNELNNKSQLTA